MPRCDGRVPAPWMRHQYPSEPTDNARACVSAPVARPIIRRHEATPKIALLEGWGELRGAIATFYSHDSHNLVVIGRHPTDMMLASVDMPISGMFSDLPADMLAAQFKNLRELSAQIADWEPPYRVFKAIEGTCLACNAGPHLTDLGLTDGGVREIVDLVLEIWPDEA